MYTEDIYSRLLAGETVDAIAAEMAKAMNDAIAKVEEEKARKAEEEAKVLAEKEAKAAKREAVKQILADTMVFLANYYPSLGITMDMVDELDDENLGSMADLLMLSLELEAMKPTKRSFKLNGKDLLNSKDLLCDVDKTAKPIAHKTAKPKTDEDVFNDFFKMMGF